jgi:type IV pilus assembly protein PilB
MRQGSPTNLHAVEELKSETGYDIEPVIATETGVLEAIDRYYRHPSQTS